MLSAFSRNPLAPLVQFEGHCLVGLVELHNHRMQKRSQKNIMDPRAYKHYNWYNGILQEELYEAPIGYRLQVFHWSIESGVREAFDIRGMQFHAVSMIIGPSMEYWYGINIGRDSFTKRGRYPRGQPINPSDQFRYLLPRCPIVMATCNCCDEYFQRNGKRNAKKDPNGDTRERLRRQLMSPGQMDVVPKRKCDKILFDTIVEDDGVCTTTEIEAVEDDDDDGEEGGRQDILFFRISMCKFRRTESTSYNSLTSFRNKLNIRGLKQKLTPIVEEMCN